MMNMKKTALAVLAFGSSAVFAGAMGPVCTPGSVTIPCDRSGWDFGIQALYLQPTYKGNVYLTNFVNAAGVTNWHDLDPDWGWGFKLEGAYHFNSGNDINVNWYHYSKTTNHTVLIGDADVPVSLSTQLKPKWDAVNLEFGQHVDFGEFKNIRFHGGVQYARISNDYYDNITGTTPTERIRTKYNGFGPRVGMDLSYDWSNGFAVYANTAGALLIGDSTFNTTTLGVIDPAGISNGSNTIIVPELEAKLGAKYTCALAQGALTLDVGYLWQNYFDAQSFLTATRVGDDTDFGLQGPYIGIKYMGYV
ncbi:Lpg1974 family pore-forming outer membrane protein [Legionella oakridgensis]|nr:Lpg1974 family pore-forming outer membrane protein [Legionella oakridgensis]